MKKKLMVMMLATVIGIQLYTPLTSADDSSSKQILARAVEDGTRAKSILTLTKAYEKEQYNQVNLYYSSKYSPAFDNYKNGKISAEEFNNILNEFEIILNATKPVVNPESLKVYIWPEGKMPKVTEYNSNPDGLYFDPPEFKPYIVPYLLDSNEKPKGAVIINAGGALIFRSDEIEGDAYAKYFNSKGYQAFVLNYRVAPYTETESALDMQRSIRYIRNHAEMYNINPDNIISVGSSAGGLVALDAANEMYGTIQPNRFIKSYLPDNVDVESADVKGIISMYGSFYPNYFAKKDQKIYNPAFPPTFFAVGNNDFIGINKIIMSNAQLLMSKNVPVELHVFEDAQHGFGLGIGNQGVEQWPEMATAWMDKIMKKETKVFNDIEGNRALDSIHKLVSAGVILGDSGSFHPNQWIKVADFVTMLDRALNIGIDNTSKGKWYDSFMEAAEKTGLLRGIASNIDPTGNLTIEQAKRIIFNGLEYMNKNVSTITDIFKDINNQNLKRDDAAIIINRYLETIRAK